MQKTSIIASISIFFLALFCGAPPCYSQLSDHSEERLDGQHDWVFFIDVNDNKSLFNYKASKLHPISALRISLRPISSSKQKSIDIKTEKFQDLWYYDGQIIGSRRYQNFKLNRNSVGTIIFRSFPDDPRHSQAAASALVQLSLDLFLRQVFVSAVVVPGDRYNDLTGSLSNYGFSTHAASEVPQMSIHLRSNPYARDEYLYWRSKY